MLLAVDFILQVAVLTIASDSETTQSVQAIQDAGCWSSFSDASLYLNGVYDDIGAIVVFGWIELLVVIVGIIAAVLDRVQEDEE